MAKDFKAAIRERAKELGIDDIGIHYFSEKDVVRHRLVQKIIQAYDRYDKEMERKDAERRAAAAVKFRAERKNDRNDK